MQRACETGWASLAGEAELVRWKHSDPASSDSDEIDGPREAVDRDASARANCENVEAESSTRRVFIGGGHLKTRVPGFFFTDGGDGVAFVIMGRPDYSFIWQTC